ncbi:Uncharacterised protein [Staphylococcus delphini]|nr:Uncharacterised protein [Staphylococcus delphini]
MNDDSGLKRMTEDSSRGGTTYKRLSKAKTKGDVKLNVPSPFKVLFDILKAII